MRKTINKLISFSLTRSTIIGNLTKMNIFYSKSKLTKMDNTCSRCQFSTNIQKIQRTRKILSIPFHEVSLPNYTKNHLSNPIQSKYDEYSHLESPCDNKELSILNIFMLQNLSTRIFMLMQTHRHNKQHFVL